MRVGSIVVRGLLDAGKGAVCCFFGIVGFTVGGLVVGKLGIAAPRLPVEIDAGMIISRYAAIWLVTSIVLGELFARLDQRFLGRLGCVFLMNYAVQHFLQTLEQLIFTTHGDLAYGIVFNAFPSFLLSLAVASLWRPRSGDRSLSREFRAYLSGPDAKKRAARMLVAALAYLPVYFSVGAVIAPFVTPYYTDPSLGLGLTFPHWTVVVAMQLVRGCLFFVAVLPAIILWKGSARLLWAFLSLAFISQVSSLMLLSYWLPGALRAVHFAELTVDSLLQAFLYVLLVVPDARSAPAVFSGKPGGSSL